MDAQQVELVGRAALETELIKHGFEVARPHRDKGIDLLVFLDDPSRQFAALPIQVKASSGTAFGVLRKYERMCDLVHVYIWNVLKEPRFFLLTYGEAVCLLPERAKQSAAWNKAELRGSWRYRTAPRHIYRGLEDRKFENRWQWLRERLEDQSAQRG